MCVGLDSFVFLCNESNVSPSSSQLHAYRNDHISSFLEIADHWSMGSTKVEGARQELHGVAAWGCWPWCRWPLAGVLDAAQLHHNTATGADGSPAQRLLLAQRATKSGVGGAHRRCARGIPMHKGELDGWGGRRRTATYRRKTVRESKGKRGQEKGSPVEVLPEKWRRTQRELLHAAMKCDDGGCCTGTATMA